VPPAAEPSAAASTKAADGADHPEKEPVAIAADEGGPKPPLERKLEIRCQQAAKVSAGTAGFRFRQLDTLPLEGRAKLQLKCELRSEYAAKLDQTAAAGEASFVED